MWILSYLPSIDFRTVFCEVLYDFLKNVIIQLYFLTNFGLSIVDWVRRVFHQTEFFKEITHYEANNRFKIWMGIRKPNIDMLIVTVKK